jgi:hypothetical protein
MGEGCCGATISEYRYWWIPMLHSATTCREWFLAHGYDVSAWDCRAWVPARLVDTPLDELGEGEVVWVG